MKVSELNEKGLEAARTAWMESASDYTRLSDAIDAAIRAYLAASQPQEAEPVEWQYRTRNPESVWSMWVTIPEDTALSYQSECRTDVQVRRLYAHPPTDTPQAEAVKEEAAEQYAKFERRCKQPMGDYELPLRRYDPFGRHITTGPEMRQIADGKWVKYEEAAARIEQLERERDEAREAEDEAKDCFWAIYPAWCELKGRGINEEAARTKLAERAQSAESRLAEALEAKGACENFLADLLDNEPDNISLPMWERAKSLLGRE